MRRSKTHTMRMPVLPARIKTAYGVLDFIARLIVDEPKRYNQTNWLHRSHWPDGYDDELKDYPKCGTIGCVAGWTYALLYPLNIADPFEVRSSATRRLGLDVRQSDELFRASAADFDAQDRFDATKPQSARHAARGAAHIRRFMRKYRAQLKQQQI